MKTRLLSLLLIFGFWFLVFGFNFAFAADPTPTPGVDRTRECDYAFAGQKDKCLECIKAGSAWTVFGCLPIDPAGFSKFILRLALGIGGGAAFLAMLGGSFMVITSAGDPERLKAGKRTITMAVAGLLVILFSLFILRLVGQEILGLPGL
jgi:hypothetical protein